MTYKKAVEMILIEDAENWVEELVKEAYPDRRFYIYSGKIKEMTIEDGDIYYSVAIDVGFFDTVSYPTVIVGGTFSELVGLGHSVIWSADGQSILWMATEETREKMNITEFSLYGKR